MVITTSPCSDSDFDRIIEIISDAFQHVQPVVDAMFPNHDTPEGRTYGKEAMVQSKATDPTARFMKAVDDETGHILGQAKWLLLQGEPVQRMTPGDLVVGEEEREYAQLLLDQYVIPRTEVGKSAEGHILILDLLSVDPKHQNRRAGSELLKWGCDLADELDLDAVVEASRKGSRLYERFGFRVVNRMDVVFPEKFSAWPIPDMLFMRRPARTEDSWAV